MEPEDREVLSGCLSMCGQFLAFIGFLSLPAIAMWLFPEHRWVTGVVTVIVVVVLLLVIYGGKGRNIMDFPDDDGGE